MIHRLLDLLFKKREIVNCDRDVYLHRWFVIRTKRFGLFIHKFVRSDEDRALHDHPWSFIVIPIWRGYFEWSNCKGCQQYPEYYENQSCPNPQRKRVYPILGARYRRAEYRHRVELIGGKPSWSIFIRFTKRRDWGFWLPAGFQQWNKWWQEKCE